MMIPTIVKKIVLEKYNFLVSELSLYKAVKLPATIAAPTPSNRRLIVKSSAKGSFITYIMIMNIQTREQIVAIFLKYNISSNKNVNDYVILPLDGITNTSYIVKIDSKEFVLRIPGNNPDEIDRNAEKQNTILAEQCGLTLPHILFDVENGIKISKYYDIYTYTEKDFENNELRKNAIEVLRKLHSSEITFLDNFSPYKVFENLADISNRIEKDALFVGRKIVNILNNLGLEQRPCHQDLYCGNFVIFEDNTYLIDWEYSSQGDPYFDFADLFWQNELEKNIELKKAALIELGLVNQDQKEKFNYFEILSMITWGLWAKRKSPKSDKGEEALIQALKLFEKIIL